MNRSLSRRLCLSDASPDRLDSGVTRPIPTLDTSTAAAALERALHERFGLRAFRPGQRDAALAVLQGRDLVAVMPTGAGSPSAFSFPRCCSTARPSWSHR